VKPSEIYRRMKVQYGDTCLSQGRLSDSPLFGPMKVHLRGHKFAHDDEVMEAVQSWLKATPKNFFLQGIRKLVDRWTKCVLQSRGTMSKNKTQTISVRTLVNKLL